MSDEQEARDNAAMGAPGDESPAAPRTDRTGATRTPSRDIELALVDAAERVLVRDGPGAVTVRAVAIEAGVAPMGVYNRFGGKDGL
ncbi:MAG TPA: helix-turn-helix domain-containing protein, partial [Nakamurella sp.]